MNLSLVTHYSRVVQPVERSAVNGEVGGSNPSPRAKQDDCQQRQLFLFVRLLDLTLNQRVF